MTFTNILGFHLNFLTSWKSCVKEQWPKKSLFWNFWLNIMTFDSRPKKKVEYPLVPERHTNLNMFFAEQIRSLSSKQSKLNFWNKLHPKIAFSCRFWTQTATWQPNHTILTSSVEAILKAMIDTVFLGPSLGGVRLSY